MAKRGRRGLGHLYRLDDVQGWLAARADAKAGPDGDLDLVQERARRDRAQRHLAEQTRETRAANLVAKDEVIAEWSAHAAAVKAKLSALPALFDLDDANRARAAALIREALDELADGNDEPWQAPAAKPKPKRQRKAKSAKPKRKAKPAKPKRTTTKGAAR